MRTVMATGHTADSSMMYTHSDTLSHQGVVITEHVWLLKAFTHSKKNITNRSQERVQGGDEGSGWSSRPRAEWG